MKKTIPKIKTETIIAEKYEIKCPYCKAYFIGGFQKTTIVHKCSICSKEFRIDWDNSQYVEHF